MTHVSLSLHPQDGDTPLHNFCRNEKATRETLRCVYELWPDAAKEKNNVRVTLAGSALATRNASLSLAGW